MVTPIEDWEEGTNDWDWFASDPFGHIGHFCTFGDLRLPSSARVDRESLELVTDHLLGVVAPYSGIGMDPQANVVFEQSGAEREDSFFQSFLDAASRGLFSYYPSKATGMYLRLAIPSRPMTLDQLPPAIADVLRQTSCAQAFRNASSIPIANTQHW